MARKKRASDLIAGDTEVPTARAVVRLSRKATAGKIVKRSAITGRYVAVTKLAKKVRGSADRPGQRSESSTEMPGFLGMLHSGRSDLSERAKDIVRGTDVRQ